MLPWLEDQASRQNRSCDSRAGFGSPVVKQFADFVAACDAAVVDFVGFVGLTEDFAFDHWWQDCFAPWPSPHCHSGSDSDPRNLQSSYLHQRHNFLQDL